MAFFLLLQKAPPAPYGHFPNQPPPGGVSDVAIIVVLLFLFLLWVSPVILEAIGGCLSNLWDRLKYPPAMVRDFIVGGYAPHLNLLLGEYQEGKLVLVKSIQINQFALGQQDSMDHKMRLLTTNQCPFKNLQDVEERLGSRECVWVRPVQTCRVTEFQGHESAYLVPEGLGKEQEQGGTAVPSDSVPWDPALAEWDWLRRVPTLLSSIRGTRDRIYDVQDFERLFKLQEKEARQLMQVIMLGARRIKYHDLERFLNELANCSNRSGLLRTRREHIEGQELPSRIAPSRSKRRRKEAALTRSRKGGPPVKRSWPPVW